MNKIALRKLLVRIINDIITPICNETAFFCIVTFMMYISHLLNVWTTDMSIMYVRNLFIGLSSAIFISWLFTAIVWYTRLKGLKCVFYVLSFLLMIIDCFLLFNYGTIVTPWILLLVKETNSTESSEFLKHALLTPGSIKCWTLALITAIAILIAERKAINISLKPRFIKWICVSALLPLLMLGGYLAFLATKLVCLNSQIEIEEWQGRKGSYAIDNTFTNLLFATTYLSVSGHDNEIAIRSSIDASKRPANSLEPDSLNVILIIGESFSKYHSPLYGYSLNTTPILQSMRNRGNLFVFNDAVAPYNMTSFSIKNMMSTNRIANGESWSSCPYFPVIFKRAGFNVSMWDNQRPVGASVSSYDYALGSYLYAAAIVPKAYTEHNERTYDYDHELINDFKQHSQTYKAHKLLQKHSLFIFHLMGQHADAASRFPSEEVFKVFKSSDIQRNDLSETEKQTVANYDNATLYNDRIVGSIIEMFRNTSSVIVYLSDHGEEVYDYRKFVGRSHEPHKSKEAIKCQYDIPFMIWCSDKYIQKHQQKVEALRLAVDKPLLSDVLPHLLFSLASITTPYYNAHNDVLSSKYVAKERFIQGKIDYEESTK